MYFTSSLLTDHYFCVTNTDHDHLGPALIVEWLKVLPLTTDSAFPIALTVIWGAGGVVEIPFTFELLKFLACVLGTIISHHVSYNVACEVILNGFNDTSSSGVI